MRRPTTLTAHVRSSVCASVWLRTMRVCVQLLGDTLFDMRKQAGGRMDLPCVKAVGLSTLAALEGLHAMGFIHRDIKPANFVISPPNAAASRGGWQQQVGGSMQACVDLHKGRAAPCVVWVHVLVSVCGHTHVFGCWCMADTQISHRQFPGV
jgi:hypothetical protein